jgi:hypothetical protein
MEENFNELTPAETERLALLMEEMAEASMVIGKILRHGYASTNPLMHDDTSNRRLLEKEVGHVINAIAMMEEAEDIDSRVSARHANDKRGSIGRWLHHQPVTNS